MYSNYINNIRLREEPREPTVGGVSLPFFTNMSSEVLGGGKHTEYLKKIEHLSVPIGLAMISPKILIQTKKSDISEDDNIIDENLFNKLYTQTAYQTKSIVSTKPRKTRRKMRS